MVIYAELPGKRCTWRCYFEAYLWRSKLSNIIDTTRSSQVHGAIFIWLSLLLPLAPLYTLSTPWSGQPKYHGSNRFLPPNFGSLIGIIAFSGAMFNFRGVICSDGADTFRWVIDKHCSLTGDDCEAAAAAAAAATAAVLEASSAGSSK